MGGQAADTDPHRLSTRSATPSPPSAGFRSTRCECLANVRETAAGTENGLDSSAHTSVHVGPVCGRSSRQHARQRALDDLAEELASLEGLPRAALRERFQGLYGAACAARLSRRLLTYAIAYRLQERELGGLDRTTRRRLDRAAADFDAGRSPKQPPRKIKPGTRLLREWQGVVHEVIVRKRGVEYRGKTWPSLSAVAREITGARWSGPRFFGLTQGSDNRG